MCEHPEINLNVVPACTFTLPEVAQVGLTEEEVIAQNITRRLFKRCLDSFQKGVNKTPKGHLLQAKRALIESQLTPF